MKEVKILRFYASLELTVETAFPENTVYAEEELTKLVNDGWNIVAASGTDDFNLKSLAFVILVRDSEVEPSIITRNDDH